MTVQHSEPVVVSWDAPAWSEASCLDDQAIVHECRVGELQGLEELLPVDVVRWDVLRPRPDIISLLRGPETIRFGGLRMAPDQAEMAAHLLTTAVRLARGTDVSERRPVLGQARIARAYG